MSQILSQNIFLQCLFNLDVVKTITNPVSPRSQSLPSTSAGTNISLTSNPSSRFAFF